MENYIRYLAFVFHRCFALVVAVAVVGVLLVLPMRLTAQSASAVLSGHVIDKSQGAVPNATVRLVEENMQFPYVTTTNTTGDFIFTFVQPGNYTVIVTAPGYKEFRKIHIAMFAQQSISAGAIELEVGAETQSVTVQADLTPLQNTTSDRAGVLDTEQMENLLMIGRDPMGLLRTMGGIVGGNGNDFLTASDAPAVNGILSEYVMVSVDGVMSNLKGTTMDTAFNADTIKEVTVQQSNYRAEYGTSSGAQINMVTKSGSQKFQGNLYHYFRNEDLNANSWSHKYNDNQARSRYRYNTSGGTLGGPVYWPGRFNTAKDKLFFTANYEYSPISTPNGLSYFKIPTAAEIGGDFSSTYKSGTATQDSTTLVHIKKPGYASSTCSTYNPTDTSGCYSGNAIPSSSVNSNGQAMLKMIRNWTIVKHPERAITDLSITQNNYNYVVDNTEIRDNHQEEFRIDYAPSDRLHTFFRFEDAFQNDKQPENDWMFEDNFTTATPNYAANITYTLTPNLVNELNAGMAAQIEHSKYNASDLSDFLTTTNSISLPALYSGTNPMNLLPAASFGVTNSPSISWDSKFPYDNVARTVSFYDNLTWTHGPHTFKFGGTYMKLGFAQPVHNRVPTFSFSSTTLNTNDTNFGYSNALAGELNTFSEYTRLAGLNNTTLVNEWYYQDTWKVARNLTIDIGLRNSYIPAQVVKSGSNWLPELYNSSKAPSLYQYALDADGNSAAKDPLTGTLYPAAYRGLYVPDSGTVDNGALYMQTAGYPKYGVNGNGVKWAPRVGFAWEFLPGTVLRGGYGLYYNARTRLTEAGSFPTNAPYNRSVTEYYSSINSSDSLYYLNAGTLYSPFAVSHAIPLHNPTPYSQDMTLSIQRQLPQGILLDVAYVGTLTRHEKVLKNINRVPYGAEFKYSHQFNGSTLPDNYYRPYPGLGSIYMQQNGFTSNYNALQLKATKRYRGGLEFGVAYTFSKLLAYDYYYGQVMPTYLNARQVAYGPSMINVKHNLVVNYLYGIPRGSKMFGDKFKFDNPATRAVLNNWQISGVAYRQGPKPYNNVYEDFDSGQNVAGGGDGDYILQTCDPWSTKIPHVTRTYKKWFNTDCFINAIGGSVGTASNPNGTQWSLGKGKIAPNTPVFLPTQVNFQTALFKNIPLKNNMKLQIRVETYNTFNHTIWNSVNGAAEFADANTQDLSSNPQLNDQFGQLNGAENPRYVQLAARFSF